MGLAVIAGFLVLFIAGFPVVYAILLPSIVYVLVEGLPLGLLAQRVTYALDSFPLVARCLVNVGTKALLMARAAGRLRRAPASSTTRA